MASLCLCSGSVLLFVWMGGKSTNTWTNKTHNIVVIWPIVTSECPKGREWTFYPEQHSLCRWVFSALSGHYITYSCPLDFSLPWAFLIHMKSSSNFDLLWIFSSQEVRSRWTLNDIGEYVSWPASALESRNIDICVRTFNMARKGYWMSHTGDSRSVQEGQGLEKSWPRNNESWEH